MDFFTAMEALSSGLSAERTRMNVASANLANAQTTRTEAGGPYRRRDPIFQSAPIAVPFRSMLESNLQGNAVQGVRVAGISEDYSPPRQVFDPGHPDADPGGYVAMPNINPIEELVNLMLAARAYEAGVTALGSLKTMADRAISIGS